MQRRGEVRRLWPGPGIGSLQAGAGLAQAAGQGQQGGVLGRRRAAAITVAAARACWPMWAIRGGQVREQRGWGAFMAGIFSGPGFQGDSGRQSDRPPTSGR